MDTAARTNNTPPSATATPAGSDVQRSCQTCHYRLQAHSFGDERCARWHDGAWPRSTQDASSNVDLCGPHLSSWHPRTVTVRRA